MVILILYLNTLMEFWVMIWKFDGYI